MTNSDDVVVIGRGTAGLLDELPDVPVVEGPAVATTERNAQ